MKRRNRMPAPDPLKVRMLSPPPETKIVPEKFNNKIFIYLTDTLKNRYEVLKGDNETWSQIGRKALKVYFEGAHTIQMPDIEEYLREIVALVTHRTLPTQPRNLDEQAKYDLARSQAKSRQTVQKGAYEKIGKELVKEIKVRFKEDKENFGLESVEVEEVEELTKQELKEKASENKSSYVDFLNKSQLTKQSFAGCKWKQQIKEVIV